MVMNGYIVETNKANILNPVVAVVKSVGMWVHVYIFNELIEH
jgi:hypothetical protein